MIARVVDDALASGVAARQLQQFAAEVYRWNQRSVSTGELAQEYGFTDVDGSRPDVWRFMADQELVSGIRTR